MRFVLIGPVYPYRGGTTMAYQASQEQGVDSYTDPSPKAGNGMDVER